MQYLYVHLFLVSFSVSLLLWLLLASVQHDLEFDGVIFKQALVVIQDMLRVFIVRIACQRVEHASILLRPIFSSIREGISDQSSTRDTEAYKVFALPL